jgi:hypothetical protein
MKTLHSPLKDLLKAIQETKIEDKVGQEKLAKLSQHADLLLADYGSTPGPHHQSFSLVLKDAILHFEVSHPKLTSLMQSINATLPWV